MDASTSILFWATIILVVVTCTISSYFDLKERIIPNTVVLCSALIACCLLAGGCFLRSNALILPINPGQSLFGGLACFLTLFPLWLLGKSGGGDVKLCTVLGITLGPITGLTIILLASLFAATVVLLVLVLRFFQRRWRNFWPNGLNLGNEENGELASTGEVPMAGYFSLATLVVLLPLITESFN